MAELERETTSAAELTLKRNSCRSKQNTLVEEVVQIAMVPGAVERGRPLSNVAFVVLEGGWGRACAWMFLCTAACVMLFVVFVGFGSQLTCACKTRFTCESDVGSAF